ncbi:hypothetical protein RA307_31170 [Xanthobacteraceae bacterium Astr-EGSB]|uniref:hypothetical protein n=1 Tax=Astrobacterium formosum TaxID=3069710 RepID=UPI0027ADDEF4|nr:hypothetical protein [Xanthobacteraceae bacterium Astr-EGSB]
MKRKQSPKRGAIDFAAIVGATADLTDRDAAMRAAGFERAGATVRRRRDGNVTLRLVWRRRDGCLGCTFVYTIQGLSL